MGPSPTLDRDRGRSYRVTYGIGSEAENEAAMQAFEHGYSPFWVARPAPSQLTAIPGADRKAVVVE
jgi:hypothetical protein